MIVFFLIVSLLASSIGAICGIGGGVIIKPVLDSLSIMEVSKISFLSSCTVLSMSMYTFIVSKIKGDSLVNGKIATPLALGGVLGGILGKMSFSYVIVFFQSENIAGVFQSAVLIFLTILTVIFTIKNIGDKKIKSLHIQNIFLCIIIGLILGFLSSFLGIGGGPFNIAFLYFFFSMDSKTAAQNSLYIILFSQIASVFISVSNNEASKVNLHFLIVMIAGGILGGVLGRFINKKIDSNTISFGVAPRINACGRMGHEEEALKLFLAEDLESATKITKELNEYNTLRQSTEKAIYEEAVQQIEKNHLDENNSIVLGGKGWHHGVIGIVSSKVTDKYYKPSILLSFEDNIAKGSGRSVPGFDLYEGLAKCEDLLEKYGGHSMAVGLTLKKENLENFKERFEQIAKEKNIKELVPIIYIDDELKLKDINMDLVKSLSILEPFGEANKVPLFLIRNLKIDSIRALSEGRHLKLTLRDENFVINAIGFELGYLAEEYRIGDRIDVVGTLEINSFNGFSSIQINMKDIRKSY